MNILAVGDVHISGKNPFSRLDDVTELQFKKLKEIVDISNKFGVPIINTGDIFHTALVANSITALTGDILSHLNNPWYFIFGNHDLQYHSLEMIERTSLGVIWANNQMVKHISEITQDYDCPEWAYIDWNNEYLIDSPYLLAHRAIVDNRLVSKNSWIMEDKNFCQAADELKKYSLIICGHWHKPYEFYHENTFVLNPGPVIRRNIVEQEQPRVVSLNIDDPQSRVSIQLQSAPATGKIMRETGESDPIKIYSDQITELTEKIKEGDLIKSNKFIDNLTAAIDSGEILNEQDTEEMRDIIATVEERKEGVK